MGSRPSSFKKGGGFLKGVDGVITGYQFTDEFNGQAFVPGNKPGTKEPKFHSLYMLITAKVDGADEEVNSTLFAGGFDDFEVSEDGLTLTMADGGPCALGGNTGVAKFIASLCDGGFPESNFSDDEESVNFEPMIGTRVRFDQRTDKETTAKKGQRKDKKTGKMYDRQDLVVDTVYDLPGAVAKTNGKAATPAKGAVKPVNGKSAKPAVIDLKELAGAALVEILEAAGGKITKQKLSMKTLTTPMLKGNDRRDDVREWLFDDDNLAELVEDGVIAKFMKKTGDITANASDE